MDERTYYVILGVSPGESAAGIRAAYRELARRHHPDVSGEQATRAFQEISEAYRVLSDPRSRRDYDERLGRARAPASRPASGPRRGSGRRDPVPAGVGPASGGRDAVGRSVDAIDERRRRNLAEPGLREAERAHGIDFDLVLTGEEATRGGVLRVPVPVLTTCPQCGGSGYEWVLPCIACGRRGVVESERRVAFEIRPMTRPGTIIEVPLSGLGIHDFFFRLHVSVDA